ncbi:hypothetical protein ACFL4L_07755, partial [bacterium]
MKVHSDDVIQIIGFPADSHREPVSLIADDKTLQQTPFHIEERSAKINMSTKKLKVTVDEGNGEITIEDVYGEILFQEGPRLIVPGIVLDEKVNHIQQSFEWADDEALYGLGQHQNGIFNWRGHYVELVQ